ncbi:MAG: TonB-dependent receptor [Xanthomonadaceae bacterium]|nr:TonB-dependent receptor [Xanthomonadaceae bacterium]
MRTPQTFKKKLLASLIATSLATLVAAPTVSVAASADATLRGHAAPGAVITAREIATGASRQTKADGKGVYTLLGLPPGTYQVSAGQGIERTIKLNVASTATLDLTTAAPAGNVTKLSTVKVSAANLQDVNTSQVGAFVSTHQIQNMPAASRNFLQFADTVPGMVFARDSNGNTSLQSGGQAGSALNVYIDGVGQKNYVLQGGIAGQNASQGNPFPQLAIAEYRVITSNYEAEYGQLSSAAVTALTKSGTNEYHGDAFVSFNSTGMRAATPAESAAGKKTPSTDKDYGFDFGGPILQNRMHFYIAYEGKKFNTPTTVAPSGSAQYVSQLPASAQSQIGAANLPFLENNWFGKLDYEPTSRDRFVFEAHVRNETSLGGIGGVTTASAGLNTVNFQKTADLRWDRSGYDWFNRLQFTYEDAFFQPTPVVLGAGSAYTPSNNQNAVILQTGNSPLAQQNKGQRGPGLRDDFTYDGLEWHGDHIIKTGLDIKKVQLTAQDAGDSNALFYYAVSPNAGTESTPYKVQFGSPAPGTSPVSVSDNTMIGAYLQDNWTVNEHWTFNLGVRGDYDRTPAYLNYVTPANVIAALNGQAPGAAPGVTYADTLALGGVNINNYISNGHNRSAKWHFAPRLGFAFDINGDQKHVIFGGYSRAYDRNLFTILQLEQTKSALSQPTLFFNTPLEPCVASPTCLTFNPSYYGIQALQALVAGTTTGKEVDMIQNNLKTPYSDQFTLGMRNQVGEWNTSVAIARINSYNGFLFDLGNRYPDGSFWKNGSQPWSYGLPGFGPLILGTNGKETRTTQLLLSADKPWTRESGWGATIAYTYTDAKWNHDNGSLDDQYAFDESSPAAYPFIAEPVAKQRLVLAGTFSAPWDIALGARLTLASPIPDVNLACYGGPINNGCVPIAARPEGSRFLLGGRIWGYRDFSLQATKNFKFYGYNAYARLDVINVFNWHNYTSYIENWGSNGVLNKYPVSYNPLGQISGYPRYLKVTVGVSF